MNLPRADHGADAKPHFVAIDFETANCDLGSICQVGVVTFDADGPAATWSSLVDPDDWFDEMNVEIHGIDEAAVAGAPRFSDIYPRLRAVLEDEVVVCHTHFDRSALASALDLGELEAFACRWLDSARVVRRAWPQYARRGYGLANVARDLGIEFRHHDALEDARAAGEVLLRAIDHSGIALEDWFRRVGQPIDLSSVEPISREGNPDGPFYGEVIAFTGALTLPRRDAAKLAAQAGCAVATGVTKKTTLLVVGDQDITKLAGHKRSSKHRKALQLVQSGQPIRILAEKDFIRIADLAD